MEAQSGLINLEDDDPVAIEAFLEFLYTDFVSEETLQNSGKELLVVASKYQVSLLSKFINIVHWVHTYPHTIIHLFFAVAACEQFLLNSQLVVPTALSMHEFAYIYGTPHFQTEVKLFVFNHLSDIQNGKEYNELNDGERFEELYDYVIHFNLISILTSYCVITT